MRWSPLVLEGLRAEEYDGGGAQEGALGPFVTSGEYINMAISSASRSRGVVVLAAAAVLAVGAGSGAVAGAMITGKDIKNRTIESQDLKRGAVTTTKVKNRTLRLKDLNAEVTDKLGKGGAAGPQGPQGSQGPQGPKGADGTASYAGPNWSIVDRNVMGNGDSYLRSGPTAGTTVRPPMGVGSLGIRTGSATDKASFGNQVDFAGQTLASITSVSFWEFTTRENRRDNLTNPTPDNLASVAFEINPNNSAQTFSTLNYVPHNLPANVWTKVTTDTKDWWLTGAAGAATNCNDVTYCTLEQIKAALPNATLYTVQVGKGRDNPFSGAIDALQIGAKVYDFEPFGVIEKTA